MWGLLILIIFVTINQIHSRGVAFQFPTVKFIGLPPGESSTAPHIFVNNDPTDIAELKKKFVKYCEIILGDNYSLCWQPHVRESYEVASSIFEGISQILRQRQGDHPPTTPSSLILSFPSMKNPENLVHISKVLQSEKCKQLLGLKNANAELYPSSPAPFISIKFATLAKNKEETKYHRATLPTDNTTLVATRNWVNNFLGKYSLCPYTLSTSRAAVGLSSVGVPVGGVHVRVEFTNSRYTYNTIYSILKASELVANFWSEVVTLMNSTQEEWATSLLVFPEYDSDFESFIDVCDGIIEPTVVATQSTDFVGRAWFHPLYDADVIGHSKVIPGHAVPHKMVEGFMESLSSSSTGIDRRDLLQHDDLARANNKVRQTPHATINILRRNQLLAAAEYEKKLGKKKPKANSVYVKNAVRLSKALNSSGVS